MGPGTYFLRVILEGARGDNMRPIVNKDTCNISNDHHDNKNDFSNNDDNADMEKQDIDKNKNKDKTFTLDESSKIRRVIFCSGKVSTKMTYFLTPLSIFSWIEFSILFFILNEIICTCIYTCIYTYLDSM
jgi:hypothetical protein